MKILTLLEVNNLGLGGFIIMIILAILFVALVVSLIITLIVKLIYESGNNRTFSKKQFIQTMLICLLVFGLISGYICGGGF
ncbi:MULTISPECIES: hypothetical protein [Chryseobacterium]|uniref:Uncharacterized protein n=1 Tax=Chryseobacterium camelliae TaxID=1265445 RepID=A0ABU0TMC2_9FLAO|nr:MULTISPECIES: hypothetical protein [Chryseobacterium]MDT3407950.1 hypothetical protein [Pseudacidovorax intermedius]MDQ1098190.1 hypothetical protein [Chryseobacterium camelliae]MDQ1102120.1 hypothetical protein [Chryseobacterium sp. SORGH_AS_1048]MDR6085558.1 hypothetical protein [Chryseobacterium sp. SORGH_AS_0909]MDR6129920.1 hypothetical protein [Chryseobacterium sp. SORGH_AS_1175]